MIKENLEKISCLYVSVEPMSDEVFESYQNQLYPDKELILVCPFKREGVTSIVPPESITLDQMKDLAVELSHGELFCFWEEQDDPYWLFKECQNLRLVSKSVFYKAGSLLYSGKKSEC